MKSKLKYIGNGVIPGIPGRDLSAEEVKEYGGESFLVGTGLWQSSNTIKIKEKVKGNGGN